MRGEYWFIQSISIVFQGSPPHAWRIPAVGTKNTAQLGITSTCVENTPDGADIKTQDEDHLHMRGEYQ